MGINSATFALLRQQQVAAPQPQPLPPAPQPEIQPEPSPLAQASEAQALAADALSGARQLGNAWMDFVSPVVEAPAPVVEAPAPVVEAPAPVVEAPAPVVEAPAPVVEAPAPVVEAPAPRPVSETGFTPEQIQQMTDANHRLQVATAGGQEAYDAQQAALKANPPQINPETIALLNDFSQKNKAEQDARIIANGGDPSKPFGNATAEQVTGLMVGLSNLYAALAEQMHNNPFGI